MAQNPPENNESSSTPGGDSVYWINLGILVVIALASLAFDGRRVPDAAHESGTDTRSSTPRHGPGQSSRYAVARMSARRGECTRIDLGHAPSGEG